MDTITAALETAAIYGRLAIELLLAALAFLWESANGPRDVARVIYSVNGEVV